jgi:hypothetical protein
MNLGTFEVTGTQLVVSDPGYKLEWVKNDLLGIVLSNCQSGTWRAETSVKYFETGDYPLIYELQTIHMSTQGTQLLNWEQQDDGISVDSGQAGIFDLNHFRDDSLVPGDIKWTCNGGPAILEELWYSYCCELTDKSPGAVLPFGVVATSGEGDGCYACSIARDSANRIVGVRILFVEDLDNG